MLWKISKVKNARRNEGKLTKLAKEVLAAKDLVDALAVELVTLGLHALGDVKILALDAIFDAALLAVEKTAWDSNVGVGFESLE